ncbi:hypothetical protein [Nocardioides sp.]|uniref:hypothetical protein n=1 Tax=Nocardioides sp. TaxID=35761 RepID=UPI002626894A|nr:hypothetical protein [Nocardioides sp.]
MNSLIVDERLHATEVLALINAQFVDGDADTRAYEYGMVPGDKNHPDQALRVAAQPDRYAVVALSQRYVEVVNLGGGQDVLGWRINVVAVGRTPNEAHWVNVRIDRALRRVRARIGDRTTTQIRFENGSAPMPDDGYYSASSSWTYAH